MRNLKRALCLALASVMVLGMTVIGASAATASDFTDYDSVEEKEALDVMSAIDVIEGTESGAFNPEGNFTREQAAKILSVMLLGSGNAEKLNNNAQIFKDVAAGKWSAGYIAYCSNVGIIAGDGQGNFNPEGELDAVSFGKMLLVALGYDPAKEGYINSPAWQQSISGDMIEAGIDVKDVKFDDILTREQATVMAFKALQTPLVEYANYLDPSKATFVTTTIAKEQTISSQTLTNSKDENGKNGVYTIEFGEKYQPSLVRSGDDTEEFCRGAHKWTNDNVKIGRYNDTPDLTYTTEVTTGQIYSDLGLSENILVGTAEKGTKGDKDYVAAESEYYIDGVAVKFDPTEEEFKDILENDSLETNNILPIKSKDDIKLGGNGMLTEVYYSDVSYDDDGNKIPATAKIVSVNTYVGDVTAKADNTAKHDAYITVTARFDEDHENDLELDTRPRYAHDVATNGPKAGDPVVSATYETEDFALGDIVLFTYSRKGDSEDLGIQSIKVADVVTGQLTAYTTRERAAIDGESYSYSNKVANEAKDKDLKFDVDVVVDEYGYAIDVDPVDLNTGYAVVLEVGLLGSWRDTPSADLLLTDGTRVNEVRLTNDYDSDSQSTNVVDSQNNAIGLFDIVQYSINSRDRYTLNVVASANAQNPVKIDNNDYVIEDIIGKHEEIRAGGNTIFLIADKDRNNEYVYTPYNGIYNVPRINTNSINTTATVFCKPGDGNVASVVYIDASPEQTTIDTSNDDYVYVKYDATKSDSHYNSESDTYYTYEAIVNGEITEINIDENTNKFMNGNSMLFETVNKGDDVDEIYSLEGPAVDATGIQKTANNSIGIGPSNNYVAYTPSDDCDIFKVDAKNNITQIEVPSITNEPNAHVWYIKDLNDILTCVIIEEN